MSIEKLSKAASDILAERDRQKTAKGWTEEHDDAHDNGELIHATWGAIRRLNDATSLTAIRSPAPPEARKLLVEAAALVLAEIERLDRARSLPKAEGERGATPPKSE